MKPVDSEEEEEVQPLSSRQTELRHWANQRIQQLRSDPERLNPEEKVEANEGRSSNGDIASKSEEDKAPWSQKSQSEAVNQLKSLLLKQCKDMPPSLSPSEQPSPSKTNESRFISNTSHNEHKTWKNELEQLKMLHQAQVDSLEAQIIALRRDLSAGQKEREELKTQLKCKEKQVENAPRTDRAPHVAGMCVKCAQSEAVLAGTHANLHVQAIDRLTKERDELMVALLSARTIQEEARQREWSSCLQVKQAVEMAEEMKLGKVTVEVQCEQLSRELARQREHLEQEAHILKKKLATARDEGRHESRKQKEELAVRVSHLSQRIAEVEGQLDKSQRDKSSLANELEDALRKLTGQEQDNTKVCVDLRYQINNVKLQKEEVERELREVKAKTRTHMEKAAQEVERLSSELVGCRQHLEAVQKDGSQWQAEALSLTEQLANAQRQLHLTRQEKESEEQAHQETLVSVSVAAQQREEELSATLQRTEAGVGETDVLLSSMHRFIGTLKEKCSKLKEQAEHSRNELGRVTQEKLHLEETVKSLKSHCSHMEEECVHHDCTHQRMTERLEQLDRHCEDSTKRVLRLMAKQDQLIKERNTLRDELEKITTFKASEHGRN